MERLDAYSVTTPVVRTETVDRLFKLSAEVLGTPARWYADDYRLPARFQFAA